MGFFISAAEDPEVMLQDAIEEMRMTMPRLNTVLVATRATVIRLEEERDHLLRQEKQLTASIQAALRDGSAAARSVAEEDALQLQQLRTDLTSTQEQLASAAKAHESAKLSVDMLKGKLKDKIETTQRALKERQKAQVLKVAADAIVELQSYGVASTADKFLEQIKQEVADLMVGFAGRDARSKSLRDSWGYLEVETAFGRGFARSGFRPFAPKTDLLATAMGIASIIDADSYQTDSIELATDLPEVWLKTPDTGLLQQTLAKVRAGAAVSAHLKADKNAGATPKVKKIAPPSQIAAFKTPMNRKTRITPTRYGEIPAGAKPGLPDVRDAAVKHKIQPGPGAGHFFGTALLKRSLMIPM
jgi:phage shock protein A